MKNNKLKILLSVLILIAVMLPGFAALAGSASGGGVTLNFPNSRTTCKPVDTIKTTGVPAGSKVIYSFFELVNGALVKIGGGTAFGDLDVVFPYDLPLSSGSHTFLVQIAVQQADGTFLKLKGKWTITCEEVTKTPPGETPTKTPTNTPTEPPTETPTETPTQPSGNQGCTPGYWRQSHHFDSWVGYEPNGLFVDAFGVDAFPGLMLREVVRLGGGSLNALGRHAVAALLNASSSGVDYPLSVDEVIDMFQDAYYSGNHEPTKDIFDEYNNGGCPLN